MQIKFKCKADENLVIQALETLAQQSTDSTKEQAETLLFDIQSRAA